MAAFDNALRKSPGDSALASRIGKVHVQTHEYVKAIEYYLEAVSKDPSRSRLRCELAELYLELKKPDQVLSDPDRAAGLRISPSFTAPVGPSKLAAPSPNPCFQALAELEQFIGAGELSEKSLDEAAHDARALRLVARVYKEQASCICYFLHSVTVAIAKRSACRAVCCLP